MRFGQWPRTAMLEFGLFSASQLAQPIARSVSGVPPGARLFIARSGRRGRSGAAGLLERVRGARGSTMDMPEQPVPLGTMLSPGIGLLPPTARSGPKGSGSNPVGSLGSGLITY